MNNYHWIIGAGHGSINPTQISGKSTHINGKIMTAGKRSPRFPKGNPFENQCLIEGSVNRDVMNYLSCLLPTFDTSFEILTPTYKDMSLTARCAKVNEITRRSDKKCIYLSIHHNAFKTEWNTASGISSHYFKKGDSYSKNGKLLGEVFQPKLVEWCDMRNRGVKGSNFKVLRETSPPALLLECGFMTNLAEATTIMTEKGKQNTARAIYAGIIEIEQNKPI
tara:strand:- start:139 stop:804 length:666 start_codon:yes stop_codon:yes gene_type:complete